MTIVVYSGLKVSKHFIDRFVIILKHHHFQRRVCQQQFFKVVTNLEVIHTPFGFQYKRYRFESIIRIFIPIPNQVVEPLAFKLKFSVTTRGANTEFMFFSDFPNFFLNPARPGGVSLAADRLWGNCKQCTDNFNRILLIMMRVHICLGLIWPRLRLRKSPVEKKVGKSPSHLPRYV